METPSPLQNPSFKEKVNYELGISPSLGPVPPPPTQIETNFYAFVDAIDSVRNPIP